MLTVLLNILSALLSVLPLTADPRSEAYALLARREYPSCISLCDSVLSANGGSSPSLDALMYAYKGQAQMASKSGDFGRDALLHASMLTDTYGLDSIRCSVLNGRGLYALNIDGDEYAAIDCFSNGAALASQIGYDRLRSLLTANLALVLVLRSSPDCLPYAQECYRCGNDLKDPYLIYCGAVACARGHLLDRDLPQVARFLSEAEELNARYRLGEDAALDCVRGEMHYTWGRLPEARSSLQHAILSAAGTEHEIVARYLLSQVDVAQENYLDARSELETAAAMSDSLDFHLYKGKIQLMLSDVCASLGDYRSALSSYRLYHSNAAAQSDRDKDRTVSELMVKHQTELKQAEIERQAQSIRRQRLILTLLSLLVLLLAVFGFVVVRENRRKDKLYRQIVRQNIENSRPPKTDNNQAEEAQKALFEKVRTLMEEQEPWRNPEFNRDRLSEMVESNRTYLSQAINAVTGQNFSQFVNSYRIEAAKKVLSTPGDDTPLKALCADVGFKSMTSFYNLFSANTQMSPDKFRKYAAEYYMEENA